MIAMQDFKRLDLRVGQVCSVETIPGAQRLLRLQIDLGQESRTLVAGLATHYAPEQLVGLKVIVVANMEPAVIRGVPSHGMMLGAGCSGGQDVALLTVNRDVPNGTRVE